MIWDAGHEQFWWWKDKLIELVLVFNISMLLHRDRCVSWNTCHEISKHFRIWHENMPGRYFISDLPDRRCHFYSSRYTQGMQANMWTMLALPHAFQVYTQPKKDTDLSGEGNLVFGRSPIPSMYRYISTQLFVYSSVFLVKSRNMYCWSLFDQQSGLQD